jgi:phage terminase large subunit
MNRIHEKFLPLFEGKTRYYVITGGRGSSKSFSVNAFVSSLTFEEKQRILFTRYTMSSAHISIIPEFEEKIELMNAAQYFDVKKTEIINTLTKSEIIFRGIKTSSGNQTANLKSIQGITTWILDEAEELVDENTFDKIDESIRVKGIQNRVILILNPTSKVHWIYKRFFESRGVKEGSNCVFDDTTYIHTTYLDNIKNLSESIIEKFEKLKISHPKKYEHRVMGGWLDKAEGVIFENWEYGKFDESLNFAYGQDFGFYPDPTTLVKVAIDKKRMLLYVKEEYGLTNLTTPQIIELNKKYVPENKLITADNAEPRLIEEMSKVLNVKECVKGPDSIISGIRTMQEFKIIVDPSSVKIAEELNNYVWSDKKSDTPIDDYNHRIDAIRYGIQAFTLPQKEIWFGW